ncbi:pol [Frog adenovirus 1]|uniref:DNA polymerase n=1 Tax=Frog adenovirus 1 (strain ATCC VR-896) TaxID=114102 RepID=Q9III3_ADEF1|nr:pol [Frog adenovirus 1]AAF86924.1 pol [Frog adenovirus 1]
MSAFGSIENDHFRLKLNSKPAKLAILDICWQFNLFNCKKFKHKKHIASLIYSQCSYNSNKSLYELCKTLPIKTLQLWKIQKGSIIRTQKLDLDQGEIIIDLLSPKHLWIVEWFEQNKCKNCGRFFSYNHVCNTNRASYYYHKIANTKTQWETINFSPIGEPKGTKKLFLVYDIETYTKACPVGYKLCPVLLCFTIFGDETLNKEVHELISSNSNILELNNLGECFYWLSKETNYISSKFRKTRLLIQNFLIEKMIKNFLTEENKEILTDYAKAHNYESIYEIDLLKDKNLILTLQAPFINLEFYVIGHNISSFDEILLAHQILQKDTTTIPQPFIQIKRNFLPRQGKILFNDITFSLPYPEYYVHEEENTLTKKEAIEIEKTGEPSLFRTKEICVKTMVRDTYQLTHCSLRLAAEAYGLKTTKGNCPFKAVTEFYSVNSFDKDKFGFPAPKYWTDNEEYMTQLKIWQQNDEPYDLQKELIKYCAQDVNVTKNLTISILNSYNEFIKENFKLTCNYNVFKRPTIPSNSQAIFKQLLYKKHGKKFGKMPDIMAPSAEMYEFVRESVRGGRCYPSLLGEIKEPIYVYDICGMYASALTHPMPFGVPLSQKEKNQEIHILQSKLQNEKTLNYFDPEIKPMIISISAFPPPVEYLTNIPPICSRKSGRLCWTNEALYDETVTIVDVITLHNCGWKVKIEDHPLNTVFPNWNTCCKEYVEVNIAAKEKADKDKNQIMRSISKLLSNSLYGSFATKEDNSMIVFEHMLKSNHIKTKLEQNEIKIDAVFGIPTNGIEHTTIDNKLFYLSNTNTLNDSNAPPIDDELLTPFSEEAYAEEEVEQLAPENSNCHVRTYQPFTLIDVDTEDLTLYSLKSNKKFTENKRYPTQLASFVLSWTRAFMADWNAILYEKDSKSILVKELNAIYGDTDSLFLTEKGHKRMIDHGQHRLKENVKSLVFQECCPDITWAVECETKCPNCKSSAFSNRTIFLAPKLYALKRIVCNSCNTETEGKLRAKGHAKNDMTFELLCTCFEYHKNCHTKGKRFSTERTALKRTLYKPYGKFEPFTIHQVRLIRELRPWHDPTMLERDDGFLIPYYVGHPNPRDKRVKYLEDIDG